jgi:signal transduction histidine kinase
LGDPARPPARGEVATEHVVQDVGGRRVPIVMFTRRVAGADGKELTLQLGLRRDALAQDELFAAQAVRSMYRVALATHGVAFAVLLGLVFWLMGRERRREERRREEEHLAFAGMMANGVVHDFRNPMSSIRLDAQMLEREARKPDARPERLAELAVRMRTTLDRIESVFQEFFFLSQPKRAAPEVLDLPSCLHECVAILQARFEAAGVTAVFRLADGALAVRALAAPLRRALLNVLANAVAFSPRGGEVEVVVARHKGDAVLDVLDRGPGIPVEERERVFEMFVTMRPGGTGLGLFLARTALASSGGRIEARGREGGGACIRIRLPLAETKEAAKA